MALTTMNVTSWMIHYHSLYGYEGYYRLKLTSSDVRIGYGN